MSIFYIKKFVNYNYKHAFCSFWSILKSINMSVSQREESVKISKFLDNFVVTNYALRKIRSEIHNFKSSFTCLLQELFDEDYLTFYSGSLTEGSDIPITFYPPHMSAGKRNEALRSDLDLLNVPKNVKVFIPDSTDTVTVTVEDKSNWKWTFEMSECCNPLFVLLKCISRPLWMTSLDEVIEKSLIKDDGNKGSSCLSSHFLVMNYCGYKNSTLFSSFSDAKSHVKGPSAKALHSSPNFKSDSDVDYVLCLK